MEDELLKYGLSGIALFAMGWFILYLMREHKKERAELISKIEKMFDKQDDRAKDTNTVIKENTNILSGLKTLFENNLRK